MIHIVSIEYKEPFNLTMGFNDGAIRHYNFADILTFTGMEEPLKTKHYFSQVKISDNGRSLIWPNGYDLCADAIRYFYESEENEWAGVAEDAELYERIELTENKKTK